jgi:alkylation response protein AidB-like acyl-CoA dehydrogenase
MTPLPADVLDRLAAGADAADRSPDWPAASWDALRSAGVVAWSVPPEYGGAGLGPVELLRGSEAIASACLTTALILSQREAAVRHLLRGPADLKARYLPGLAAGTTFLTVGLSQLTTSRQHHGPALRATPAADGGFVLDGDVPWVTGAGHAAAIVAGATLPDATQVLVVLPTDQVGVTVGPPMPLAALAGSRTCPVQCDGVAVGRELVLAGPSEHVVGKVGGGGLETSCLALGLASAAVAHLRHEAAVRTSLTPVAERFDASTAAARERLHSLATTLDSDAALALRVECTRLALRTAQAGLLAAKGTGFVVPHPAQRWARQALFFLVWSCPRPVADGVLADLLPGQ